MRHVILIFLFLVFADLLPGCRCARHTSKSSNRTDISAIDVRSRSLSRLRDTLAERQTIRIEYYEPSSLGNMAWEHQEGSILQPSADVGGNNPTVAGGREPSVKSIEIVTERNSCSSMTTIKDSTNVSQNSTKETLQQEAASEARQDNGTLIGIAVVAAVAFLCYLTLKEVLS